MSSENLESRHFINGIEIRPKDADKIGVKMDWTTDNAIEAELTVDSIVLENKAKKLVIDHIDTYGIFEGIPYTFQINNFSLEYFIELVDDPRISGKGDSSIEVNIKRRGSVNKFWQDANGLSWESLNRTHPISTVEIPYLIVSDNQLEMLIMLAISAFSLTKTLIEGIEQLQISITDFIKIVSIGAVVNTGQIIASALLLIAQLIYVVALIIALIDVTKQIVLLIFPPIRNFLGTSILHLCQRACEKLGYEFQSSILEGMPELTILPTPLVTGELSIIEKLFTLDTGYHTKGYPTSKDAGVSTFGRLLKQLQAMFNAKVRVLNGRAILERRDYWILNSGVSITRTLNLQNVRENQWRYNSGEWWKRYYIHYLWDVSDFHTMDRLEALDCEYSTEPVSVTNPDLVSIKGLVDIPINFAFATRKNGLTWVEQETLPYAKLADDVVNFFGGSSSLVSKVIGRVGVTIIGQQYFAKTKIMFQTGGRQPDNYRDIIGANTLYQKYHKINQVKENFKREYTERIKFSTQQFEMLLENNYVTDQNGNSLEILTFDWVNEGKEAEITYTEFSNEGFNTKTILING
tara:strand:+ start:11253 stop:12983 length:1731 start_codon:yes stop_codon:yes gene_type:complete